MTYRFYYLSGGNGEIFYVGTTTAPLKTRLSGHKAEVFTGRCANKAKAKKIEEHIDSLAINEIETVRCSKKKAAIIEGTWISKYKKRGHELTNSKYYRKPRKPRKPIEPFRVIAIKSTLYNQIKGNLDGFFLNRWVEIKLSEAINKHIADQKTHQAQLQIKQQTYEQMDTRR